MTTDARRFAPATERNREPILAVLSRVLPPEGTVLEVSSGTGEHAAFFAPHLAPRYWLPSDVNPSALESIAAWQVLEPSANLHSPIGLDACEEIWPVEDNRYPASLDLQRFPITGMVNINMIHISPWEACRGLMAGAGRILSTGGVLYLYGPYKRHGKHTAPSNEAFDTSLQSQNPSWGVRDLEMVVGEAESRGMVLQEVVEMPANNLSVIFQKKSEL